jgi:uncharacterized protein (TIGR04255 family)
MNTAILGTWRKPPLAYVVAELVISPYYSMGNAVQFLQDKLRTAYPRTVEAQELVFDGNKASPQQIWRLFSADQQHGIQLGTRAIGLHATRYLHSNDFLSRWAEVLDFIGAAKLGAFVERAGLRYVDLIVPATDRSPTDYLEQRLQGVTPDGAVATGSMWAAGFQFNGCVVNLRSAAPAPKGLLLPPDFNALPLHKPKVMIEAEGRIADQGSIGFIDTDCVKDIQNVFNASELVGVYTEMQKLTSRTFKAALSPLAKAEWI